MLLTKFLHKKTQEGMKFIDQNEFEKILI